MAVVVRGYRADRVEAIGRAVREVVEREELAGDLPPLEEDRARGVLATRTDPRSRGRGR